MDETPVAAPSGGRLMSAIGRIGADADDTDEVRLQKTLLVASTLMMTGLATVWGGIYAFFGEFGAAAIPWSYAVVSFASTVLFGWIRRYRFFRFSQLFLTLILPFALMIQLGGFIESSAVVLWSLISPLALSFTFMVDGIGTISSENFPACWPAATRCCDCKAYSSCASRLMP